MRVFFYWLIRAGAAAGMLVSSVFLWLLASEQMVMNAMNTPEWSAQLSSLKHDEVSLGMMNLVTFGVSGGVFAGAAALFGWVMSRGFAKKWTWVVPAGEGDAAIHPAVIHVQALSPEERQEWASGHPSHSKYVGVLAAIQLAFGALIYWFFSEVGESGDLPVNLGAIVLVGYVLGLCVFESIRFGGWISRRVRRWTGMPAEVLAQHAFQRDAGVRD